MGQKISSYRQDVDHEAWAIAKPGPPSGKSRDDDEVKNENQTERQGQYPFTLSAKRDDKSEDREYQDRRKYKKSAPRADEIPGESFAEGVRQSHAGRHVVRW